jgi:hypothetical protein
MKFALIGDDPQVLPVIRAIAGNEAHSLEGAALLGNLESQLHSVAPGARLLPRWDAILTSGPIDALLVCGHHESVLEAARQIAAAGTSLLILPQSAQGSTWIYELSLIRDEGNVWIVPIFARRAVAGFKQLRSHVDAGTLGKLLYLRIDCELAAGPDASGPLVSKRLVDNALLQDVDLLRFFGGDYSRVTAGHSGAVGDQVAAATATLAGEGLPEATWMTRGTSGEPYWNLVIAGERGEIAVTAAGNPVSWSAHAKRVSIPAADLDASLWSDEGGAALASIERLFSHRAEPGRRDAAAWTNLVRAFEVVDAARVSIRRRRAIDLHSETASERNLFKSQMTAFGCLTLTLTLVGVLFLLLLMPLLDVRSRAQIEAERADAIVRRDEFKPQSAELNESGADHIRQLAAHLGESRFPILIEQSPGSDDRGLDQRRRDFVTNAIKKDGGPDATERTQVAPIVGEWYPQALRVVRVLVFAPLALFLALQALVFLTRPSAR